MTGAHRTVLAGTLLALLLLVAGSATAQKANLVVEDVSVDPSKPEDGDATAFPVTVSNQGDVASEPFDVRWILDGDQRLDDTEVGALDPGEVVTVSSRNWSATQGDHTIKAIADATDRTPESDETDNVLRVSFTVAEAQVPRGLVEVLDARLHDPRQGLRAAPVDGTVYLLGGTNGSSVTGSDPREILAFDPDDEVVEGTNVSLGTPLRGPAVVAADEEIHVLGGEGPGGLTSEVRTFDPDRGTVTTAEASLPSRWCCGDAFWNGTHVLLVGGRTRDGTTASIVSWEPGSNETHVLEPTLPEPREGHRVVWDGRDLGNLGCGGGCAYVVGGANASGTPFRSLLRYHPDGGNVEPMSGQFPPNGSVDGAVVWTGRYAYAVGGEAPPDHLRRAVRYDPVLDDRDVRPARLPSGRHGAAGAWAEGRMYVFGGHADQPLDEVVRYRPGKPDLALRDLRLRPPRPTVEDDVTFRVEVANEGEVRARNYTIRFGIDGERLSSASFDGLDPNRSLGLSSDPWSAGSGAHEVTVSAVLEGSGGELTLDNNDLSHRFAVNEPPTSAFEATVDGLNVTVNASRSSDPDGAVAAYRWTWGDGSEPSHGPSARHTYGTSGNYTITLAVTDGTGARSTTTRTVTPNRAPKPAFNVKVQGQTVIVDATPSTDPDGDPIASYLWDWDDNTSLVKGVKANHTYEEIGIYEVALSVRDVLGADAVATKEVEVWGPIPAPGPLLTVAAVLAAAALGLRRD